MDGVYRDPNKEGLISLLIPTGESFERTTVVLKDLMPLKNAARYVKISSAGLRRLRDAGYLEQIMCTDPQTKANRAYLTKQSIERFEARFITLGQLANRAGRRAIHVAQYLDRLGVEAIECETGFVRVYEKSVEALFEKPEEQGNG